MKIAILISGIAALVIGGSANGSSGAGALVVPVKAKHGSGVSGTATFVPAGKNVRVVMKLNMAVPRGAPAHVHTGPCKREPTFANPRIYFTLNSVFNATSDTIVKGTLASLRARTYSINVHDPNSYGVIACADIPRA